jgi:hypothetical protein
MSMPNQKWWMWKPEVIKMTLGLRIVNNLETAKEHAKDIKAKTDMFGRLSACFTSIEIVTHAPANHQCQIISVVLGNFYSEKSADLNIFIRDSNAKECWGLGKAS